MYISIEKIVLLSKDASQEDQILSLIEIEGLNDGKGAVAVKTAPEDLIKMINGEDKIRIGFRTSS